MTDKLLVYSSEQHQFVERIYLLKSNDNSIMNKEYIIKCALAFSLTKDNDDSRDDSFARLMVLHVFDLDMHDVAHTLKQQNEIYWDDTRITKSLLITLLLSGEENNSDQNDDNNISKSTSIKLKGNEWTMEDDMAVIYALEIFNLALVDLKRYF
jgi:hypothetical protein